MIPEPDELPDADDLHGGDPDEPVEGGGAGGDPDGAVDGGGAQEGPGGPEDDADVDGGPQGDAKELGDGAERPVAEEGLGERNSAHCLIALAMASLSALCSIFPFKSF